MTSEQHAASPALDLDYAILMVVISGIIGYFIGDTLAAVILGGIAMIVYLLYRIWWTLELIAARL